MVGGVTPSSALERDASTKSAVIWVGRMPNPLVICGDTQRVVGAKRPSKLQNRQKMHQRHASRSFMEFCAMAQLQLPSSARVKERFHTHIDSTRRLRQSTCTICRVQTLINITY
jgi:hypothetical protein